ncbi:hypothetical protein MPTK1_2g06890 [Marchantia polymorpha subsp. ruderalis]|nr:hypothetical protein MARPO_0021s0142 [Marchantia polymorpha]BBN01366.1 hypothetical protein Mp_2g06890 [Marchantia polymorpha subsp. ruderalis]|eukprot:PTQ44292.1 hypothetical protein MARPO_0021s0142 [Marchantia polymorpha]
MAQESTQPNKKIDAKEDLVFLTSGAKEKLSKTIVGASETAYKMLHPFNKEGRDQATEKAKELKREVSNKQSRIRATAHQQAEQSRLETAQQQEAPLCPISSPQSGMESGPDQEQASAAPYDHMSPSSAQPSQVQNVVAHERGVSVESCSSSSSSDGSSRAGIAPTAADYRSA